MRRNTSLVAAGLRNGFLLASGNGNCATTGTPAERLHVDVSTCEVRTGTPADTSTLPNHQLDRKSQFGDLRERTGFKKTGVYLVIGQSDPDELTFVVEKVDAARKGWAVPGIFYLRSG